MSGIPSWCFVGAKVVFIGNPLGLPVEPGQVFVADPEVGSVCTVVHICREPCAAYVSIEGWPEDEFAISCFRPLITKTLEQDIAQFLPLLTKVGEAA